MQTISVECGSGEANYLNSTLTQVRNQATIVRNGFKEKSQTTSTPYVTQYWNGYSYVSQTKYHYNTVTQQIPINMDYEKKVLQQYLDNLEIAYSNAKTTQNSCQKNGMGTFTLNHGVVTNEISTTKFLLN